MTSSLQVITGLVATLSMAGGASAGICDYRPSAALSTAAVAGGAAVATVGSAGMQAAGFYTLVHASSGLTMLGSTLAGASAAGTIGIIGGTAGLIGSVSAVILAPVTLIVAGGTVLTVGGLELGCFLSDRRSDERITDYMVIEAVMRGFADHHQPDQFQFDEGTPGERAGTVRILNPETQAMAEYRVANLYIVNGTLMHRDWGPNTNLGQLAFVETPENSPSPDTPANAELIPPR